MDVNKIKTRLKESIENPNVRPEFRELAQELLEMLEEGRTDILLFIAEGKEEE